MKMLETVILERGMRTATEKTTFKVSKTLKNKVWQQRLSRACCKVCILDAKSAGLQPAIIPAVWGFLLVFFFKCNLLIS